MNNQKKYSYKLKGKIVWIPGHNGMVGAAIKRKIEKEDCKILTVNKNKLDLTNQNETWEWIRKHKPNIIFLAAAKVGGISANKESPGDFLYQNLAIQNNVIEGARINNTEKLVFIGSSCIYPKYAKQPINEAELLSGPLEKTNEAYAIAKIAGLKLCLYYRKLFNRDFISVMPTNLYGPRDNYDPDTSHVMGALIKKIIDAKIQNKKEIEIWGTGKPRREFLHVDDLADAVCFLAKNYSESEHINIGHSKDISIIELAQTICDIVDLNCKFKYDKSKPDGTPQKKLNIDKLTKIGWAPKISLKKGISKTIKDYVATRKITINVDS